MDSFATFILFAYVLLPLIVLMIGVLLVHQHAREESRQRLWQLRMDESKLLASSPDELRGKRGELSLAVNRRGDHYVVETCHGIPGLLQFSARAGPGQPSTGNPVLDGALVFAGEVPLRWDDERLTCALLAVLHAYPGSEIDGNRIRLRGRLDQPLAPALDAVAELVAAMNNARGQ